MIITTRFELGVPVEGAWAYLLDVQRIAHCVPGASLTQMIDDRTFEGKIEVKLGPIAVSYKGRAAIEEVDEANHRVRVKAQGAETRGRAGRRQVRRRARRHAGAAGHESGAGARHQPIDRAWPWCTASRDGRRDDRCGRSAEPDVR